MVDVGANYREIVRRIGEAAARSGRDAGEIRLLAASKSQGVSRVREAIRAGVRLFGENYVQEARAKRAEIQEPVEWHMIGHLQRNKVKFALELFDLVESLDSIELARELDREGGKTGRTVRVFVEVNLGGEESKSGVRKKQVEALLREIGGLTHLKVEGLMAIPPFRENPEETRPYFRGLRDLREELGSLNIPNVELRQLSMGMTQDYEVAIEEGATLVRLGTALFGPRE